MHANSLYLIIFLATGRLKDIYFMTDGTDWVDATNAIPYLGIIIQWELCHYKNKMIAEKYFLSCVFGTSERLVYRFGMEALNIGREISLQKLDI